MDVSIYEDNECTSSVCQTEIVQLKQELYESKKRIQAAKEKYHQLLVLNVKKDVQIGELEIDMEKYDGFCGIISDEAIGVLSSIDHSKSKDSFFISVAVKDLYQNDLSKLKQKTYSGRQHTTAKTSKNTITPEKKSVLKELFCQRMKNATDSENRMNSFAKHVKQAIQNINKTNK